MRPTGLRLMRMGGGRGRGIAYGGNRGEYTSTAYLVTLRVAAPAAGLQQAAPGGSAVRGGGQGRRRARPLRGTVVRHLHLHEFTVLKKIITNGAVERPSPLKRKRRHKGSFMRDVNENIRPTCEKVG